MKDLLERRYQVQNALLDMIAQLTKIPFGLYEFHEDEFKPRIPKVALENFEPHCKLIQSFPGGRELCESDQCNRTKTALKSQKEELVICHAGMYNQMMPIRINGVPRAALVYGEMQIEGEDYRRRALQRHREAVSKLNLSAEQATQLREYLLSAKIYTPEQLETLKKLLSTAEQWLYALIDEEERAKTIVERTTHEINTRLQAIIANAENLALEIEKLSPREAAEMARNVLDSAKAFDTVVQTLGDHLEDYSFKPLRLGPLIQEARDLYDAEAARRGIEIRLELQRAHDPAVAVYASRRHLQVAINNLVHNAIKYTFHSKNRRYFVTISGQPEGSFYRLSFINFGIGILEQEYDDLFKEGYQGKLTKDEYRSGSGKGLYFVKRIIDNHKGRVEVESRIKADGDTPERKPHLNRFTIYLPYKPPKES